VASDRLQTVALSLMPTQDSIPRSVLFGGMAVSGRPGLLGLGPVASRGQMGVSDNALIQRDPAGLRGLLGTPDLNAQLRTLPFADFNQYTYANNNPLSLNDPLGLMAAEIALIVGGGVVALHHLWLFKHVCNSLNIGQTAYVRTTVLDVHAYMMIVTKRQTGTVGCMDQWKCDVEFLPVTYIKM